MVTVPHLGHAVIAAGCATIGGIFLGLPQRDRPGGIRTHVMVMLGAAMFCSVARQVSREYATDPLRVLQGIATGVGFIGAASVLKGKTHVVGVNTAASIWVAAAIGCEISLGNPYVAVLVSAFVGALNAALHRFEAKLSFQRSAKASGPRSPPPA